MTAAGPPVSVVVLAKDTRAAKSRLRLPGNERRQVALLLAASTVRTALAAQPVGAVFVVTGDPAIAEDALQVGAEVVAVPRLLGMNRAAGLGHGRALAARPHAPVAVMVADLPDLRPDDLDLVVAEFVKTEEPLFVSDRTGSGTTLVIHGPGHCPGYGFGRGSAATHRMLGYRRARCMPASLRRDLDTPEDLVTTLLPRTAETRHRELASPTGTTGARVPGMRAR